MIILQLISPPSKYETLLDYRRPNAANGPMTEPDVDFRRQNMSSILTSIIHILTFKVDLRAERLPVDGLLNFLQLKV